MLVVLVTVIIILFHSGLAVFRDLVFRKVCILPSNVFMKWILLETSDKIINLYHLL